MRAPKSKKVIIFTSDMYAGGVAESTRKIVNLLSRVEGVTVILVVYECLDIKKSIPSGVVVEVLGHHLVREYHDKTIRFFNFRRVIGAFFAVFQFARLRWKYRPVTVYSLMYLPNIINAMTGWLTGKTVLSERQNPRYDLEGTGRVFKLILGLSYAAARRVHVNSVGLGDELVADFNVSKSKIFYFPNFFNFKELPSADLSRQLSRRFKVLLIGRLSRQKGFIYLPSIVKNTSNNIFFTVVANGDYSDIKRDAIKLGVFDRISFVPEKKDLTTIYQTHDMLLVTSLWESFGNVIVEAMSHGLPIVANRCPTGPIDILANGAWGLLIENSLANNPEGAVVELAAGISNLSNNSCLYEAMSLKSIRRSMAYSEKEVAPLVMSGLYLEGLSS